MESISELIRLIEDQEKEWSGEDLPQVYKHIQENSQDYVLKKVRSYTEHLVVGKDTIPKRNEVVEWEDSFVEWDEEGNEKPSSINIDEKVLRIERATRVKVVNKKRIDVTYNTYLIKPKRYKLTDEIAKKLLS